MLGTVQDKLNERAQAVTTYMRVSLSAGAPPGFVADANISAGQLAQETNKLDTAKRAYEEALMVITACCLIALVAILGHRLLIRLF